MPNLNVIGRHHQDRSLVTATQVLRLSERVWFLESHNLHHISATNNNKVAIRRRTNGIDRPATVDKLGNRTPHLGFESIILRASRPPTDSIFRFDIFVYLGFCILF